ncbi:S-locus-specific glycoprotein [Cardamine amara subsp. amara]|uniref:S-locus-specific glycoprotein n=1 Tax=Cardamine amara subsp. amara TaxID=228776 RepID=A0ABD1AZ75_CARAN
MRSLPQYPNFFYTFFFFSFLILFSFVSSKIDNTLSSNDFLTPSGNRTIVSLNKLFELGFLKLASKNGDDGRWYLGMWYKAISKREYVWVANRDNPLPDST